MSLLLDPRVVSRSSGVELVVGSPRKHECNPLFGEDNFADAPRRWEARFDNLYPNVLREPATGRYRAWYSAFLYDGPLQDTPLGERAAIDYGSSNRIEGLLYAESDDGITWSKPNLGIVEFDGSTDNNIVMSKATHGIHAGGVLFDPRDPDPSRRFKALFRSAGDRRMAVAFSPDGLRWGSRVLWPEHDAVGDTHNNALWCNRLERYIGITRGWTESPYHGERTVLRTESEDFIHWSEPEEILRGSGLHDQIYSMPIVEYGGGFIGLPAVFHKGDPEASDWDTVDTEVAFSTDSHQWQRVCPGEALVPRGAGAYPDGDADAGCVYAAPPIVDEDGTIRIYYGGSNGLHNGWREGTLNLAVLPSGRFAGLASDRSTQRGTVLTNRLRLESDLRINIEPSDGGSVTVAVLNDNEDPIPGFGHTDCQPVSGNAVDEPITWRDCRLDDLPGQPVRLEFELSNATLFSFDTTTPSQPASRIASRT